LCQQRSRSDGGRDGILASRTLRTGKEFDGVAVWVGDEKLERAVGSLDWPAEDHPERLEVFLPDSQVIDAQGEVVAARLRNARFDFVTADDVQFLGGTEPEPRARKVESRAGDLLQLQNVAVKGAASFDVAHANGDMIQFQVFQLRRREQCGWQFAIVDYRLTHESCAASGGD
jgi:hypothetical protein